MAPPPSRRTSSSSRPAVPLILSLLLLACCTADAVHRLTVGYYDKTCPGVQDIVRSVTASRVAADRTLAPAMLRLFFHDCFVQGCDASVLLDATPNSGGSEKDAKPNQGSLRGFDVVDAIKSRVERACPGTVSCADVLALASRDAVALLGGPSWSVQLGRKDSRGAAGRAAAERGIPSPRDGLANLTAAFRAHGLGARDLAALSGAHTVGAARCRSFRDRVYGTGGAGGGDIDPAFAERRRGTCQSTSGDEAVAPLDELTPVAFDIAYYRDLVARRGLLASDQALYGGGGGQMDRLVEMYSADADAFVRDFSSAMVKMGRIPPPQGMQTEVRLVCNKVN